MVEEKPLGRSISLFTNGRMDPEKVDPWTTSYHREIKVNNSLQILQAYNSREESRIKRAETWWKAASYSQTQRKLNVAQQRKGAAVRETKKRKKSCCQNLTHSSAFKEENLKKTMRIGFRDKKKTGRVTS